MALNIDQSLGTICSFTAVQLPNTDMAHHKLYLKVFQNPDGLQFTNRGPT